MEEGRPTRRVRGGRTEIAAELAVVAATLAGLAGSTALVISMYRRPPTPRNHPSVAVHEALPVEGPAEVVSPAPIPPTSAAPEALDPTPAALAELADRERQQKELAGRAVATAEALETARNAARKRADSARRDTAAIRSRAAELREQADRGAIDAEMLAMERDMLVREIDRKKADQARAQARAQNGYAIQPYKGPNGTWRCPIVVECSADTLAMPPNGPVFSTVDLGRGPSELRAFLVALNRASAQVARRSGPDGAETIPYVLFVVRPDGIRPYYAAKALIEPLGVAFGYELVGQGVEVDYPDLGDPASWPDVGPLAASPGAHPVPGLGADGTPAQGLGGLGELARTHPPRHLVPSDRLFDGEDPREPAGSGPGMGLGAGSGGEGPTSSGRPRLGRAGLEPPGTGFVPRGRDLDDLARSGPMPGGRSAPNLAPRALPGIPNLAAAAPPSTGRDRSGSGTGTGGPSGSSGNPGGSGSPSRSSGATTPGRSSGDAEPRRLPILPDAPSSDLELVVVCSRDDVVIHPGAYRLTAATLKAQPNRLVDDLKAVVMVEQVKRRGASVEPRIRFLIQSGAQATFELARGQTLAGGINWPSRIQLANADPLRLTRGEVTP